MNNKLQLTNCERRVTGHGSRNTASALIIAVILTSLLAIIGMMFVMIARVDKMATSAVSENKQLNFAAEAVVAKISQELVLDVPGVAGQKKYYNYPDNNNPWLASLEPYLYSDGGTPADQNDDIYYWRHISDIYNKFGLVTSGLQADIKPDYQSPSEIGDSNSTNSYPADADGDGVVDSNWVLIPDMNSSKGKPIYVAVRVIDNGGMLNVNTVFKNPGGADTRKGDMLTDIYIDGVIKQPGGDLITTFLSNRSNAPDAGTYYNEAARRIENPDTTTNYYTFYDISEELSLRNRFVLVPGQAQPLQPWLSSMTRLESYGPPQCLATTLRETTYGNSFTPYTSSDFVKWKRRMNPFDVGVGSLPSNNNYDFRHLLTTYNTDRIIDPCGAKMTNVNDANVSELYYSIRSGLMDANYPPSEVNGVAAQIAVDINDYRDSDSIVSSFTGPYDGLPYYGFETPCIYISELAHRAKLKVPPPPGPCTFDSSCYDISYAIELYKPYAGDIDPSGWQLVVGGATIQITNWTGNQQFCVIKNENPALTPFIINGGAAIQNASTPPAVLTFKKGDVIELQRPLPGGGYVTVDSHTVPDGWWDLGGTDTARSIQRDTSKHKCIRRLWADAQWRASDLGVINSYIDPDTGIIQAHPANALFTNVGEIGMLFVKAAYYPAGGSNAGVIGYNGVNSTEPEVRLNLADPNFQQLFKYLTVFDPNHDLIDNDGDGTVDNGELKIHGRININTAPWYVLAQLPWVSQRVGYNNTALAQAIVAYRDKLNLSPVGPDYYHGGASNSRELETGLSGIYETAGFRSIGELMNVINTSGKTNYDIRSYALDGQDLKGFPDIDESNGEGAVDDFEERDVIFARLSNLVTVRSDVFTAYILVRIGKDGPQKRVMAILDRSNVRSPTDKVRIIALHPVPDPR